MTMPNFLVIGRGKSGTTALYEVLKTHPEIWMSPVKEPQFFVCENGPPVFAGPLQLKGITRPEAYQRLFAGATTEKAIGEASPQYSNTGLAERAAQAIQHHIPDVRLIAILRQPADYTYSLFYHMQSRGIEPARSLRHALAEEQSGQRAGWYPSLRYGEGIRTYPALKAYYDRFSRQQIRVYLYEEWNSQPQQMLGDLLAFLDVDSTLVPPIVARQNVTATSRSYVLHRFMAHPHTIKTLLKRWLPHSLVRYLTQITRQFNRIAPPPMDPELRRELTEAAREDILRTRDLIGRDLSAWLRV